ncbi:hypothetical protein Tco_0521556 [Tanacetum coccineum]
MYVRSDSVVAQMEALFSRAASTVVLNIEIDGLDDLDAFEVWFYFSRITGSWKLRFIHQLCQMYVQKGH